MKLEKWALIAEIVSGLAVLITVIVLVIGVKDNTNATHAAVYENLMSDLNQFNLTLVDDPELSTLWFESTPIGQMNEGDASRRILLNRVAYRIYEASYFSFRNGSLGEAQWERFAASICNIRDRSDVDLWASTISILTSEFRTYIEEICPADLSE